MKSLDYQLIAERKLFPKKLFITEGICILFGSAIMITDILLMVFLYKKIVVSTIVLACIFFCVLLLCSIQIGIHLLCNKSKREAILYDPAKEQYLITTILGKEIFINKKEIADLEISQPLFDKNKGYGTLVISYMDEGKKKKISLSFLLDLESIHKKMHR